MDTDRKAPDAVRVVIIHAAPAGKAARRLAETLRAEGYDPFPSMGLSGVDAASARRVVFCTDAELVSLYRSEDAEEGGMLRRLAAARPGKILVVDVETSRQAPIAIGPLAGKRLYSPDEPTELLTRIASADSDRCLPEEWAWLLDAAREGRVDVLAAVKDLQARRQIGAARRLLEALHPFEGVEGDTRTKLFQQLALCTYKDLDLPRNAAFTKAAALLEGIEQNAETCGLLGAVAKRRWEVFGVRADLEQALAHYAAGARLGGDRGYTAINQAFVLDALAHTEEGSQAAGSPPSPTAVEHRREADKIRAGLVDALALEIAQNPEQRSDWWFRATVAEALFGLGQFHGAAQELKDARREALPSPWMVESTARQLASLALYQRAPDPDFESVRKLEAWKALAALDLDEEAITSAMVGKLGLALSGGGFRASLFHIGVLARLAELDVLRHVEAISCVSGGSIIGAHYYLALKALLEQQPDGSIDQQAYIDLVKDVERRFLEGVQKNLRMQVVASVSDNIEMLAGDHSRTERLAALYDQHLYGDQKLRMADLRINPSGSDRFSLKQDNWRRRNKVPVLVLNAATLNTGHAWQFTASYMGEPPSHIDDDVDGNPRLRRVYYDDAQNGHQDMRLSHAVAASSGVPGLFAPIELRGLHQGQTVQLVDGGVHDNQGTASLLEQDCSVLLISDASGQMGSVSAPSTGALKVLLRTNDVFQSRVRTAQFREMDGRRLGGLLRGLMYLHLKRDIGEAPVPWIGCQEPLPEAKKSPTTDYDMPRDVQAALAALRTDLDSFSDLEAHALMLSGYRMTSGTFRERKGIAIVPMKEQRSSWDFQSMATILDKDPGGAEHPGRRRALELLGAGASTAFKTWRAVVPARLSKALKLLAALVGLGGGVYLVWRDPTLVRLGGRTAVFIVGGLVLGRVSKVAVAIYRLRTFVRAKVTRYVLSWLLAGVAKLHFQVLEKKFLSAGRLAALGGDDSPGPLDRAAPQ